jgi:NAD/NADP transhydrogenase alpha subunit
MNPERPVIFRFRRPGGSTSLKPSAALVEALQHLSRVKEMQPLMSQANKTGREVVIEVFHAKSGHPLLIHTALVPDNLAK